MMKRGKRDKDVLGIIVASLVIAVIVCTISHSNDQYQNISWKELSSLIIERNISRLEVINNGWVRVELAPGIKPATNKTILYSGDLTSFEKKITSLQHDHNIDPKDYVDVIYKAEYQEAVLLLLAITTATLCLAVLHICIMNYFKKEKDVKSNNVGIIEPGKFTPRFKDIGGCEEAKTELMEFVDFFNKPDLYKTLGAKLPKGAILAGPPGTGKTLLGKAAAAEANISFFAVSGSEFYKKLHGPSRVCEIFAQARRNSPCILFIDEIDVICRKQRKCDGDGDVEFNSTLNQLLVEMDGFDTTTNVVVMGTTNRVDCLDSALWRKGRFDRKINVPVPNIKGRKSIFEVHLGQLKTNISMVNLSGKLADLTPGFTGDDIANLCNRAALIAARNTSDSITMKHFEQAIERYKAGMEEETNVLKPDDEKKTSDGRTVWHDEGGYAQVTIYDPND